MGPVEVRRNPAISKELNFIHRQDTVTRRSRIVGLQACSWVHFYDVLR
jgi:hypothetical protein